MLVLDTETRTDASQRLTFGSYRFFVDNELREEGLFYADDLLPEDRRTLEKYVAAQNNQVSRLGGARLLLLTRREFLKKFYKAVYKGRALLVGFNLPFDMSRIAFVARPARGRFAGGFSLPPWSYVKQGIERPDPHRPSVGIKQIDSKRALKGFTARFGADASDLIPEDSPTGEPEKGYKFLALKRAKLKVLVTACGRKPSRRELIELRAGRSKPHRKTQELLVVILKKLELV
jgi:hypothetical protein